MNAKVFFVAFTFLCLAYSIDGRIIRRSANENDTTPAVPSAAGTNKPASTKPEDIDPSKQGKDQEVSTKAVDMTEVKAEVAATPANNPEGQDKIETTTSNNPEQDTEQKQKAVGGLIALYWLLNLFRGGQ